LYWVLDAVVVDHPLLDDIVAFTLGGTRTITDSGQDQTAFIEAADGLKKTIAYTKTHSRNLGIFIHGPNQMGAVCHLASSLPILEFHHHMDRLCVL